MLLPRSSTARECELDFYIRSPQQNPKNKPNREVFMHFFGMEITWK